MVGENMEGMEIGEGGGMRHFHHCVICGFEYECGSYRTYAELCEEERVCVDCGGIP